MRALTNECGITAAYDPSDNTLNPPTVQRFVAIWDTGATDCVITQRIVDALQLQPTGMVEIHGVHGKQDCPTYIVNIYLPNHVAFAGVRVTLGVLSDADMLIGMNIITRGDFAVTNKGGVTKFSFRVPSEVHLDFVKEQNLRAKREGNSERGGTKGQKRPPKRHGKAKKNKR